MKAVRIYRSASRHVKWQFWMTTGMGVVYSAAAVSGQTTVPAAQPEAWLTPQNLIAAVTLFYGFGMTIQNFRDQGKRLDTLEKKVETFIDQTAPNTYVRQDVLIEKLGRRRIMGRANRVHSESC